MIDFYVHYDYHKMFSLKDIMKHYDGLYVLKYVSVREHVLNKVWLENTYKFENICCFYHMENYGFSMH